MMSCIYYLKYLEGSVKSSLETSLDIDSMFSFSDSSGGGLVRLKIIHLSSTTDLRIEIFLSFVIYASG